MSYLLFLPRGCPGQPLLVVVHGSSTEADEPFELFVDAARTNHLALVSVDFTGKGYSNYQQLEADGAPLGSAQALEAAVADAASVSGIDSGRFDVVGFSGGAQFVHRYALLFPQRVRRAVVVSAGWYTALEVTAPFPRGSGASPRSANTASDVMGFLGVPVRVMVGDEDVERDPALRKDEGLDRVQGRHRLARAIWWVQHVGRHARGHGLQPCISFELLPLTDHSLTTAVRSGQLVERVMKYLALQNPCSEPALP